MWKVKIDTSIRAAAERKIMSDPSLQHGTAPSANLYKPAIDSSTM